MTNQSETLIGGLDPEITARLTNRRGMFTRAAVSLGAIASAPLLLGAVSQEAFASGLPQQIVDTLNFALTLEYLEEDFYRMGLKAGIIPRPYITSFKEIGRHEAQHVGFLKSALGGAAVKRPQFDFTAGGKYGDVFSNFKTFLTLSETFEDLGVAAYKGQAGNLMDNGDILTAALRIHSVEARHAAQVRRIGGKSPWTGAFDDPKSKFSVLLAAKPFIVS